MAPRHRDAANHTASADPTVFPLAAVNSLLESGGTTAAQTARWTLTLQRKGAAPLRLSDMVVSETPVGDLQAGLVAPLRFLYNNPFSRLELDSVAVRVETEGIRKVWSLRSARVLEPIVRPGGTVQVSCELERWRGGFDRRARLPVFGRVGNVGHGRGPPLSVRWTSPAAVPLAELAP